MIHSYANRGQEWTSCGGIAVLYLALMTVSWQKADYAQRVKCR